MRAELVGEGDLVRRLTAIMREHGLPAHADRFTVTVEPYNVVRVSCDFVAHERASTSPMADALLRIRDAVGDPSRDAPYPFGTGA